MRRRYPFGRILVLATGLGCAVAGFVPAIALGPLAPQLEWSLTPQRSAQAAVYLLRGSTGLFLVLFLAWPIVLRGTSAMLKRLTALSDRRFWTLTALLAVIVRIVVAGTFRFSPVSDAGWYHEAAQSLSQGEGLRVAGQLTAYRFPGYPFLLSLTYRLLGPHIELAWFWGLLSTLLIVLLTHRIGCRLYGGQTARIAALALALYPAMVLRTGLTMSDLPFVAGLLVLVVVLQKSQSHHSGQVFLLGALLACLALTRGTALCLALAIPVFWLLDRRDFRRVVVGSGVLVVVVVAGMAPWALRNKAVFGRAVLSTNVGLNFFIGNHKGASGGYLSTDRQVPELPPGLNEAELDLELLRRTTAHVAQHPFGFVALIPGKLFHLYAFETNAVTHAFQGSQRFSGEFKYVLYGVSQLVYFLVLVLFLRRAAELRNPERRPRGSQWAGWLLVGYFTLMSMLFFGEDRYRLPIFPFMLIEASHLLSRLTSVEKDGDEPVSG